MLRAFFIGFVLLGGMMAVNVQAQEVYQFDQVELQAPIEMDGHIEMFSDGGTLAGKVIDANGRELEFCLDGRMMMKMQGEEQPLHVFLYADHPESDGATEVSFRGPQEQELVRMLQDWVDQNLPVEEDQFLQEIQNNQRKAEDYQNLLGVIRFLNAVKSR